MNQNRLTREEWLNAAIKELKQSVIDTKGVKWPEECKVKVSCGWAHRGALSKKSVVAAICYPRGQSKDGHNEIFVSPLFSDGFEVLYHLVHELVHAIDDCKSHHKGFFLRTIRELGLEGKPTSTHPGEMLTVRLNVIMERLGTYPHACLNPGIVDKKQSTRLVKAECPGCGYVIRTTRKWIKEKGLPTCPCDTKFEEEVS